MTPDEIAVLRATPRSDAIAAPAWKIADAAGIDAGRAITRLLALSEMGLAEVMTVPHGRYFVRTPVGDREAGRAR